jgi:peroxiredoxin
VAYCVLLFPEQFSDLQARLLDLQGTARFVDLPFPLLADPERTVGKQFNVPLHLGQFPAKSSFLIGPDNTIRYVYDWLFRPRRHVARILADISSVRGDD